MLPLVLDNCDAALHLCCMTTITMTKRGSVTIPPDFRRRLGVARLPHPLFSVEEREGGLFLQPATAVPVRNLSRGAIQAWIKDDEAGMAAFRAKAGKKPR